MVVGDVVRAFGLGLTLSSALILMWGQPWDPKAIRDRWITRIGFSTRPIVGEVYVWLNARLAATLLICGIALQLAGAGLGASSTPPVVWWSLGAMIGLAVAVTAVWLTSREPLVTRRLVLLCRDADMPDVSDIQFLWHLDRDRALPLVTIPPGLPMESGLGAPPGDVAQRLLRETAYGRQQGFERISIISDKSHIAE